MRLLSGKAFLQKLYCSTGGNNYSKTVLLPKTKFPLRLDGKKLIERDNIVKKINDNLYLWQRSNLNAPEFVLHDGPPYANGATHMGHAINKILKDVIVRTKILQGQKVHYVPGWDCHGLPIELKAIKNNKEKLTPIGIREKARNFASQAIEMQKASFMSWGVLGDWDNPYKTFNLDYIKNQLIQFYNMYEKKLIYRDVKPVYWSPSSRTALAEAELEYNLKHKSLSATVRLKLAQDQCFLEKYKNLYLLIWTTTPWTLPSNQAVCYNKNLSYSVIKSEEKDEHYIVATNLVPELSKNLNQNFKIVETFLGEQLTGIKYKHPVNGNELPLLPSDHATDAKGTGLVHTAPAHGPEDFLVALNHNIKILCMVDEDGKYTEEAGHELKGLSVLSDGTDKILSLLKDDIIHLEDFVHSYPYDWRTKKPVILRASKQWFIDTNAIKDEAANLIEDLEIIPKTNKDIYKQSLVGQLKKRPFWCISRQRVWGVPIPVFYEKATGKHIINREITLHLCSILEKHGPDYWWKLPLSELLPKEMLNKINYKIEDLEKGQDILDIWFDSGISWSKVLSNEQTADLYLEGLDQFTGWFQSSLTTSIALRGKIPYKCIYVHGFALDGNGRKMSKSLGNVIDPEEIMYGSKKKGGDKKAYGVDCLRWWVACHANQDSAAHITKNVLDVSSEEVQKVRNVMRFALGSLNDFDLSEKINYDELKIIDKYLLHELYTYKKQVDIYLQQYQFHKVCQLTINFLTNQVSALYYSTIKDRLYCDASEDINRKSAQFVLYQIFKTVTNSLAPIIPHLMEELYSNMSQSREDSIFKEPIIYVPEIWDNTNVGKIMEVILNIRRDVNKNCDGNTTNQLVEIELSKSVLDFCKTDELCDILQVSEVCIKATTEEIQEYKITIRKTQKCRCDRCRKYASDSEDKLCSRCQAVVSKMDSNNKSAIVN